MSSPPAESLEIADTLEAVRRELEGLVVRGLRAAGPADTARLCAMRDELRRAGASHLAERLTELLDRARADDPAAPAALMRTLSSLRVFERVLTLDTLATALESVPGAGADDPDEDDEDDA